MTHESLQNSGMVPYNEALAWASEDPHIARIFRGARGFIPLEVSRTDIDKQLKRRGAASVSEVVYPDPQTRVDRRIVVGCYKLSADGEVVDRLFGFLQFGDGSMYVSDREYHNVMSFFVGNNE